MSTWEDMLEEFRALGGTADNVLLGEGAFGRGLFPIDPSLPVVLRVPENLLIDTRDIAFENGRFRVSAGSSAGPRERAFIEGYQAQFSWDGGGRGEIERIFAYAQALPGELRHALRSVHGCGAWFDDPIDALVQEAFLRSRSVVFKRRTVVMPVLDLINHGRESDFDLADGVAVRGIFSGEVLVRYSDTDAFGVFLNWGFASAQPVAFSVWLTGNVGATRLRIDRDTESFRVAQRTKIPVLTPGADDLPKLSFLMIGCPQFPGYSRGIFDKVMREAGLSGFEESFDTIHHANRMHFLNLLLALEDIDNPIAHALRRMALHQLRDMSFSFGVRRI